MEETELTLVEAHLFALAKKIVKIVCDEFGLTCKKLTVFHPEDPDKINTKGMCDDNGVITLSLRKGVKGKFYELDDFIDTVIHEIAHLKYMSHNKDFYNLLRRMKRWFKKHYINPK